MFCYCSFLFGDVNVDGDGLACLIINKYNYMVDDIMLVDVMLISIVCHFRL